MANNIKSNTSFWAEISDYKIQVPYYQRDYAQGRKDGEYNKGNYVKGRIDNIRKVFVGDLFEAICDKGNSDETDAKTSSIELSETKPDTPKCHLGLVFGSYYEDEKIKRFIAVDGQQRLTTVFLLHWYVAWRENKLNDYKVLSTNFSWDTRSYSSQFVKLLFKIEKSDDVICAITTNPDYFSIWESDPTVKGMLTMLKEIEDQYPKGENDLCSKLFSNDCNIRYDILKLEKDSDEKTYLKMNSRGRSLTTFELFKSEFIDNFKPGYAEKFDNKWLKFMLEMSKTEDGFKDPDICYMNFINEYTYFQLRKGLGKEKEKKEEKEERGGREDHKLFINAKLKGNLLDIPFISFKKYKPAFENKLEDFEKFFDWIVDNYDSIREIDGEIRFNNDKFFLDSIIKVKDNNPYYSDRAKFFAAFVYADLTVFAPVDKLLYLKWTRVFRNLIENTDIDDENFGNICKAIYGVDNPDIYIYLLNNNIAAFDSNQVKEEIAKAKKIVEDSSWEKIIKKAEECPYLKGKIWVLFQNGDNTELEQFKLRLDLLNAIIENPDEYYLPKILLSYYDKQKPETSIELKKSEKNWKTLLTDNKNGLFSCFQKIQSNSINADIRYQWIKDLSTTQLLNNSRNDAKIVGSYGRNRIVLWGTSGCRRYVFANEVWGNVIIGNHRTLLMEGDFDLQDKNIVVPQTNFVSYFDVNFKYNNNFFQWYGNPNDSELDVYLMNGIWCDYKRRSDFKEGRPDKDNYYCFEVDDTTTLESFKQMLNNLIQEAEAHDQPCYNECQNK